MYENPGDELYFGEVYRQVLQEAWLPKGAELWSRLGKSRRGWRPTQRGLYPRSPTAEQAAVRLCFSKCVSSWNSMPWDTPSDPGCDDRWGKGYWKKEKDDRGVPCSYYDLFMRYCLRHCFDTACVMPSAYTLDCGSPLTDVRCWQEYSVPISGQCGSVSLSSGPGSFSPPSTWTAPLCGEEDVLYFQDANGATGCLPITFDPAHHCNDFTWPASNPDSISRDSSVAIFITGGIPPYRWIVSGEGFSLGQPRTGGLLNSLFADSTACGAATILVIDYCDQKVTGTVLCDAGIWVLKSTDTFSFPGVWTHKIDASRHERIVGKKRQYQYWASVCSHSGGVYSCDAPWICNDDSHGCSSHTNCVPGGCQPCITGLGIPSEFGCHDTGPGAYYVDCVRSLLYWEREC